MTAQLTAERLRSLLDYNPETGVFFWRVNRGGSARKGSVAGAPTGIGYVQLMVDFRNYKAHRLAWLYVHGQWPEKEIDHINGIRNDNRIENLREANRSENLQNQRKAKSNSRSGVLGVNWSAQNQCWRTQIQIGGANRHIGYFKTLEDARAAYLAKKSELHPFSAIKDAA